jgi:hypothetical protein
MSRVMDGPHPYLIPVLVGVGSAIYPGEYCLNVAGGGGAA